MSRQIALRAAYITLISVVLLHVPAASSQEAPTEALDILPEICVVGTREKRGKQPYWNVVIRRSVPGATGHRGFGPKEGGVSVANLHLHTLIAWVYGVPTVQVFGPEALRQAYDISADVSPSVSERNRYGPMMRDLLARHLGVELVLAKKEMEGFVLKLAPSGKNKLKKEEPAVGGRYATPAGGIEVEHLTFEQIANQLSDTLGRPVVDKTGLNGRYTFTADVPGYDRGKPADFTVVARAFEEQIGLRLTASKVKVKTVTVTGLRIPDRTGAGCPEGAKAAE